MRYSHSKLEVARACLKQFKFKYIDKIDIKGDTSATDFGQVCHTISENYTGGGKEELLKLYHALVPSQYVLTDYYRKKVPLALKNIHDYWVNVLSKYENTQVKKEDDITTKLTEDIDLNGKIDIYITANGRLKIVDYKTSKSKEYANHTNQLAMYMFLLHKKFGISYENMDCEIIYLALDEKTKKGVEVLNEGYKNISKIYKLDETDIECLIAEIDMIHTKIKKSIDTGKWKPNPTWFNCTYCPFNEMCEDKFKDNK